MNKIIKTYHTPFWNPLETFSSWIRSIRAKVEKQLPHINTLWDFSLCLNLRTLPAIEKGGAWWTRQTRVSSLTQREFILPVLHSAAWRTTTSQHVYYMVSFFTCKFHRGLWESCLYAFEMKESWFAENDNECIFFFFGLENLIDVNASYSRIFLWLWLCPYRCLFSSKRCTQFLLTKNTSNVSRAFVFNSALDVHTWATRDRSIL